MLVRKGVLAEYVSLNHESKLCAQHKERALGSSFLVAETNSLLPGMFDFSFLIVEAKSLIVEFVYVGVSARQRLRPVTRATAS